VARILVLDDDSEVRQLIAATLDAEGHEVSQADRWAQADQMIGQRLPDLILADLVLPDGDGLEWISRLLQHEKTKEVPIIVVSALRQKKKIIEGLKAGAVDYITKPFDVVELKVRVISALKIHELKREQGRTQELDSMRETARTVRYEIELPMQEIQRALIQLRTESEDFNENDRNLLGEAWDLYARLESILGRFQNSGG